MAFAMPDGIDEPVEATATTDEDSVEFATPIERWVHITVDGPADVRFSFDAPVSAGKYFTLKAGESIRNVGRRARTLHWQAVSGTSAFRALGMR